MSLGDLFQLLQRFLEITLGIKTSGGPDYTHLIDVRVHLGTSDGKTILIIVKKDDSTYDGRRPSRVSKHG